MNGARQRGRIELGRGAIHGGVLAAELCHDPADFRKLTHGAPQFAGHLGCGIQR